MKIRLETQSGGFIGSTYASTMPEAGDRFKVVEAHYVVDCIRRDFDLNHSEQGACTCVIVAVVHEFNPDPEYQKAVRKSMAEAFRKGIEDA